MRGPLLSLSMALPLLGVCAPSLPPEFESGTTCTLREFGAVHLAFKADCTSWPISRPPAGRCYFNGAAGGGSGSNAGVNCELLVTWRTLAA